MNKINAHLCEMFRKSTEKVLKSVRKTIHLPRLNDGRVRNREKNE